MSRHGSPRRVSLPTYPFAKERCWVNQETPRVFQKSEPDTRAEKKQRTYYSPQWTLKALAASEGRIPAIGPILILDTSDRLFLAMKERLDNDPGDGPIVLVKPGKSFQEIEPNSYVIDPEREEQFQELVRISRIKAGFLSWFSITVRSHAIWRLNNR